MSGSGSETTADEGRASALLATLRRFPWPVSLAVLATLIASAHAHPLLVLLAGDDFLSVAILGFFAAVAAMVAGEAHWPDRPWLPHVIVLVALLILGWTFLTRVLPTDTLDWLVLGVVALPFVAGPRGAALWAFAATGAVATIAAVAAGLVTLGLSQAVLMSVNSLLLDGALPKPVEAFATSASLCLVPAFVALRMLPTSDPALSPTAVPLVGTIRLVAELVLIPLVICFALVLHLYLAKVAASGLWPSGVVGPFVVAYVMALLAAWHVAWPWRASGALSTRLFFRYALASLVAPLAMLAFALFERTAAYGWTEPRLATALLALILAGWVAAYGWRPSRLPLRASLLSLAAAFILASAGPWTLTDLAVLSQTRHLRALVAGIGDGDPSPAAEREVRASAYFLASRRALARVLDLLPPDAPPTAGSDPAAFARALLRRP